MTEEITNNGTIAATVHENRQAKGGFGAAWQRWEKELPYKLPPALPSDDEAQVADGADDGSSEPDTSRATTGETILEAIDINEVFKGEAVVESGNAESQPFRRYLEEVGMIGKDAPNLEIAETLTLMMNDNPAVRAKDGKYDVTPEEIAVMVRQPYRTVHAQGTTASLVSYRAWQAYIDVAKSMGASEPSLHEFWGVSQKPTDKPALIFSRDIYQTRILPLLDREENRHIQSSKQIVDELAYGEGSFLNFMNKLYCAYLRNDGKPIVNITLEEALNPEIVAPNDLLAIMAKVFHCEPEDIIPRAGWQKLVSALPASDLKVDFNLKSLPFDESKLRPASQNLIAQIHASGIKDTLFEIRDALNKRLTSKQPKITILSIRKAIEIPLPFGRWDRSYESLIHRRILEVVNEKRAEIGLTPFTTEELYGVERNHRTTALTALRNKISIGLVDILCRPENSDILRFPYLHEKAGTEAKDLEVFFENLSSAYVTDEATHQIKPCEFLTKIARAINCEETEIVSHETWHEAIKLSNEDKKPDPEAGQQDGDDPFRGSDTPDFDRRAEAARAAKRAADLARTRGIILRQFSEAKPLFELNDPPEPDNQGDELPKGPQEPPVNPVLAAKDLPVDDKFAAAAYEVAMGLHKLDSDETAVEFTLMEQVEGINPLGLKEDVSKVAPQLGIRNSHHALEILEEAKTQIAARASEVSGLAITNDQVSKMLSLYYRDANGRRDLTGIAVLTQWLASDRGPEADVAIGNSFGRPLTPETVKNFRENVIKRMAKVLQS